MKTARSLFLITTLFHGFGFAAVGANAEDAARDELVALAEAQQWEEVERLLQVGCDVNAIQADGMTALHWATYHDANDVAKLLLKHHADPSADNRYGVTPLAIACMNGNPVIARNLLDAGADVDETLNGGETMLMIAARTGQPSIVADLLQRGVDVDAKERNEQTAIMWAAAEGHRETVSLLLDADAEWQRQLDSGFNAFFFAVREGHIEIVDLFRQHGADVNDTMKPKRKGGRIARYGTSPLMLAIENGHFELAAKLLEWGADPNDQRSGFTPLHAITWTRKPNLGDGIDGDPPPIGSGSMTSLQIVRELIEHGADVNARLKRGRSGRGRLTQKGATPFFFAADTADVSLMTLLLELGADPHLPNADDCPPLLAAAGLGTLAPGEEAGTEDEAVAATTLLLELGADINAVDRNGETAMHGAAYASFPKIVSLLNERGIRPDVWNRKNRYGWTPLLIAEGHRPGNFKPDPATIEALRKVLLDHGITPPDPTPQRKESYEEN